MYLKFELTEGNIKRITELRQSGVNLTEYFNQLIACNDIFITIEKQKNKCYNMKGLESQMLLAI